MAKKRKINKKLKKNKTILSIIIVAVIIIAVIIGIYSYQKQQKNIQEVNKFFYDSLLCISNCPVTILLGSNPLQVIFDEKCTDNCRIGIGDISEKLQGVNLNDTRIIVNSKEFRACKNEFNLKNNADNYKYCLQNILPGLKEKFGILN